MTLQALTVRTDDPLRWQEIQNAAAAERFDWTSAAETTIATLYSAHA